MKKALSLLLLLAASTPSFAVDLGEIEKALATTGVEGWIHGASPEQGLYVFTYRNPKDFFDSLQMSLVSFNPEMLKKFATFSRHDKVRILGKFLKNPSPQ